MNIQATGHTLSAPSRSSSPVILALVALLTFGGAVPGQARPDTFETISPEQVAALLGRLDRASVVKETRAGKPVHVLDFGDAKGVLRPLLCENKQCRLLRLSAIFKVSNPSLEELNRWNADHRYSRAYVDEDGDVVLASDLDLDGGVNDQDAMLFLEIFADQAGDFVQVLR